jgi:hypothetical protein
MYEVHLLCEFFSPHFLERSKVIFKEQVSLLADATKHMSFMEKVLK